MPLLSLLVMSPVKAMPTIPLMSSKKSKKLRDNVQPQIDESKAGPGTDEPAMTSRIDSVFQAFK
jgi:hypothetical protein